MAEESGQEKSLSDMKQQIAHSRDWLARDVNGLRYELDFPLKFRRSFQRQTIVWIAVAIVIGVLIVTAAPARRKEIRLNAKGKSRGKQQKEGILGAGLALGVLKLAATLLRPVVVSFVTRKMSGISRAPRPAQKW
ncbi:MAG: hypothetical protein ABJB22_05630 [Verrucomicrobiota bacterium]